MKKIALIITILIMIATTVVLSFMLYTKYEDNKTLKEENKKILNEISEVNKNIENTNTNNDSLETQITELQEEKQAELKELQIWKNLKEKLNQALS